MLALALTACGTQAKDASAPGQGTAGPAATPAAAQATPAAAAAAASAPAPAVIRRVVLSQGRQTGTSVITTAPDGTIHTSLAVLENGRGPRTEATFTLAADGTLASFRATGNHTFGATFEASFERAGTQASWKSPEESGSLAVQGPAFFLPVANVPELRGLLAAAAMRHGGSLAVLPAGTARVEAVGELTLTGRAGARTVVAYATSGLSLQPFYTWHSPDGSWFGTANEWFSVVPEGWQDTVDALLAKQRELRSARATRLAKELAHHPPAAGLAFTHARVLDVERGRYLPDHTVVVVGSRITAMGPSRSVRPPDGAEIIDLAGKALVPGMVDMHGHTEDTDGVLHLAAGVTLVRDVGNDPDTLEELRRRFDTGETIGPHLVRFGFIEGRNPKAASSKITAETPEEARAAVEYFAQRGYQGIKIYNSVRPELVPLLAEEAHRRGLQVTGHIPVHMLAHEAVRAGYDGIEHINMLFLNFFATHETDTRDTTRFTLVGDHAATLDLRTKPVQDFFRLLRERKTVIDPTLHAFEGLFVAEPGKVTPGLEELVARLPVQARRGYVTGGLSLEGERKVKYRAAFDKLLAMTRALVDAGVRVVVGTDTLAGLTYQHELLLYERAGIRPARIWQLATIDPARYLGVDQHHGSIAVGKLANLVVVDGDPLARLADLRRVVSTMRGGVLYSAAALFATLNIAP